MVGTPNLLNIAIAPNIDTRAYTCSRYIAGGSVFQFILEHLRYRYPTRNFFVVVGHTIAIGVFNSKYYYLYCI